MQNLREEDEELEISNMNRLWQWVQVLEEVECTFGINSSSGQVPVVNADHENAIIKFTLVFDVLFSKDLPEVVERNLGRLLFCSRENSFYGETVRIKKVDDL